MGLAKEKAAAFFSISLALVLTAHLLFRSFALLGENQNLLNSLLNSSLLLFNPIIFLSFFTLGAFFGWVVFIFSAGVLLIAAASSYSYEILLGGVVFFAVAWSANKYLRGLKKFEADTSLRMEQWEGRMNLLNDQCEKERRASDILRRKYERYGLLKASAEKLSSITSLEKITDYLAGEAFGIIGKSDAALLFLIDEEHQELRLTASKKSSPTDKIKSKKGDIFDAWLLKYRKPLLITDTRKDFRFNIDLANEDYRHVGSLISAPLISERRVLGIIRLESAKPDTYSADDLRLLDVICDLGALAIANCILYKKTEELAITDGLTGLYVRGYFAERMAAELKRAATSHAPLSFLMIDIDRFKDYNDKYGHVAGDIVLRRLAVVFRKAASTEDLVCRLGGEEFAILLVGKERDKTLAFSEALRNEIEKEEIVLRREKTKVTVSMGISFYPSDGADTDSLMKLADGRLYKAKAQGRNRLCAE